MSIKDDTSTAQVMTGSSIPDKAAVARGIRSAYEAEGYLGADGITLDAASVRQAMFAALNPDAKVERKTERNTKAITRGAMVEKIFPHLAGPESFSDQPDPQLAQVVWKEIDKRLWGEARTNAGTALQDLVGQEMGNGYFLVRRRVGRDRVWGVYITDDYECLMDDFVTPDQASLQRKAESVARDHEELIRRQPHNARRYERSYMRHMKAVTDATVQQLTLARESVALNGSPATDETEEDAES